jgi:hypothetical protein
MPGSPDSACTRVVQPVRKGVTVTARYSTKGFAQGGGAGRPKQVYRDIVQLYPDQPHDDGSAPAGKMVCTGCHAVYERKHWHISESDFQRMHDDDTVTRITQCPGCKRIAEKDFRGELTILGPPLRQPVDERYQRILDAEARAKRINPIGRVGDVHIGPGRWTVQTTTPALAVRLGHELQKAFGGDLSIDRPPQSDMARVMWIEAPSHVD